MDRTRYAIPGRLQNGAYGAEGARFTVLFLPADFVLSELPRGTTYLRTESEGTGAARAIYFRTQLCSAGPIDQY